MTNTRNPPPYQADLQPEDAQIFRGYVWHVLEHDRTAGVIWWALGRGNSAPAGVSYRRAGAVVQA